MNKSRQQKKCAVLSCQSDLNCVVSFNFPKDQDRKRKWMSLCRLTDLTSNKRICRDHFEKRSFYNRLNGRVELRSDANPEIDLPSAEDIKHLKKIDQINLELKNCLSQLDTKCKELDTVCQELRFTNKLLIERTEECDRLREETKKNEQILEFYSKFELVNPIIKELVHNEVANLNKSRKGFRYSARIKMFCLYINMIAPKTYRSLRSIFNLPAKETLFK